MWVSAIGFGVVTTGGAAVGGAAVGCGFGAGGVMVAAGVAAGVGAGWDFAGVRKIKMKAMMAARATAPAAAKICMRRFGSGAG